MKIYKKQLKSGLEVVALPVSSMRSITSLVVFGNGSRHEKPEENGISHFLEHMLFKGTKKRPTEKDVFNDLDQTGGEYNGLTGKEWTGYYVRVRPKHFRFSLEWLADVLFNSLLEEEKIEKEKGVILEERNMYLDTPMRFIWDVWEELLWQSNSLGQLIIGSEENIKKFGRKDFLRYFKARYGLPNLKVIVAGNAEPSDVFSKVRKYFNNLEQTGKPEFEKVSEGQSGPQVRVIKKDTDQNHLSLGFRGYGLDNEKRYAQSVLANVLGGMRSSRFFVAIRDERGMAYYLNTLAQTYTDTGYVTTTLGVNKEQTKEAVRVILEKYKEIRGKGPGEKELKRAKENIKGGLALELESSNKLAFFVGKKELLGVKEKTPEDVFEKIDAVREEDVKLVARELFTPESLNLAMIGGKSMEDDLKKIINNF